VYSLGIMLFELLYPMYTGMERHLRFAKIRRGEFPEDWLLETGGDGAALGSTMIPLLRRMLAPLPPERPTAEEVVQIMESLLREYTVVSLDLSSSASSAAKTTLLRVEAADHEAILSRTLSTIRDAAPSIAMAQYGLRSTTTNSQKTILEFALVVDQAHALESLITKLQSDRDISMVRQVSNKLS